MLTALNRRRTELALSILAVANFNSSGCVSDTLELPLANYVTLATNTHIIITNVHTDLDDIAQPDDIGMINLLQYNNLVHERLLQFLAQPFGYNLLDRHLRPVDPVPPVPHHRERSRPYLLPHLVIPDKPTRHSYPITKHALTTNPQKPCKFREKKKLKKFKI